MVRWQLKSGLLLASLSSAGGVKQVNAVMAGCLKVCVNGNKSGVLNSPGCKQAGSELPCSSDTGCVAAPG